MVFLCAVKLCVALALAVCAVGGVFVLLGWGRYPCICLLHCYTLSPNLSTHLTVDLRFADTEM